MEAWGFRSKLSGFDLSSWLRKVWGRLFCILLFCLGTWFTLDGCWELAWWKKGGYSLFRECCWTVSTGDWGHLMVCDRWSRGHWTWNSRSICWRHLETEVDARETWSLLVSLAWTWCQILTSNSEARSHHMSSVHVEVIGNIIFNVQAIGMHQHYFVFLGRTSWQSDGKHCLRAPKEVASFRSAFSHRHFKTLLTLCCEQRKSLIKQHQHVDRQFFQWQVNHVFCHLSSVTCQFLVAQVDHWTFASTSLLAVWMFLFCMSCKLFLGWWCWWWWGGRWWWWCWWWWWW